jgi:hypothetical protein
VVIDECHQPIVVQQTVREVVTTKGENDEKKTSFREMPNTHLAPRELCGIGEPDLHKRPLRARVATWGLTGTPMLSSETRTTELAALVGGSYICGGARHWRRMERASGRDIFLECQEVAASREYRALRRQHAQQFVTAAVQRNKAVEFKDAGINIEESAIEGKVWEYAMPCGAAIKSHVRVDEVGDSE